MYKTLPVTSPLLPGDHHSSGGVHLHPRDHGHPEPRAASDAAHLQDERPPTRHRGHAQDAHERTLLHHDDALLRARRLRGGTRALQIGRREDASRNRRPLDAVPGERLRVVSMVTQLGDRAAVRRRKRRGGGVQILTSTVRFVAYVFK